MFRSSVNLRVRSSHFAAGCGSQTVALGQLHSPRLQLMKAVSSSSRSVPTVLENIQAIVPLPKMIVLDLDYTLWPFWCEMYTANDEAKLYPNSRMVLDAIRAAGVAMAVASRTPTPDVANAFMDQLGLKQYFDSIQLIPASSGFDHRTAQKDTCHFPNIRTATGISYEDMLFFDDEEKNVRKVACLGVTSVLVSTEEGLTAQLLVEGLRRHASRQTQNS